MPSDAAIAAIKFALRTEEGLPFLQCWLHGNFDAIRREWTDCPKECFVGADPSVTPADAKVLPHTHPDVERFTPIRKGPGGTELAVPDQQLPVARALMLYGDARRAGNETESAHWFGEAIRRVMQHAEQAVQAKQAKLDAVMLEHCPAEMSEKQRVDWAAHQVPADGFPGQGVAGEVSVSAANAAGEMVDATSREFPGFFLIAAITRAKAIGDQIQGNPVSVRLMVNGVDLPFTATMDDLWARAQRQLEEDARKMAERMVTEAGLDGVADALREVEWKVKEALAKVPCPELPKQAASGTAHEMTPSEEAE